jgi:hypothetical protein
MPAGPPFPPHVIQLCAANHILPPPWINGVYPLPTAHESISCVAPGVPRSRRRSRRTTSWQSRRATRISICGAEGQARMSPMIAPPTRPVSRPRPWLASATCSQRSVVRGRHSGGQGEGTPNSSKSCQSILGNMARNPGKHVLLPEPLAPVTKNIIAARPCRSRRLRSRRALQCSPRWLGLDMPQSTVQGNVRLWHQAPLSWLMLGTAGIVGTTDQPSISKNLGPLSPHRCRRSRLECDDHRGFGSRPCGGARN